MTSSCKINQSAIFQYYYLECLKEQKSINNRVPTVMNIPITKDIQNLNDRPSFIKRMWNRIKCLHLVYIDDKGETKK